MSSCPITGENLCKCRHKMKPIYQIYPRDVMRKLFTDHAKYTEEFVDEALNGGPMVQVYTDRLMLNQVEIGNYLGRFVGDANGQAITTLLKEHILAAANVVKTLAVGGNLQPALAVVTQNVDKVATALSGIPCSRLTYEYVKEEFGRHNNFVVEFASLHFQKKYAEEVAVRDAYYVHMLFFADMLTYGLIGHN